MQNAHLRLGLLEYVRFTEKISTRIRLRVDRYMGEDRQAHLLSVFGNDSDVGAITALLPSSRPSFATRCGPTKPAHPVTRMRIEDLPQLTCRLQCSN